MGRLLTMCCTLLCLSGCGLAENERDEENKSVYIPIPDRAFEQACLRACDLDGDGRVSRYEAQRVLYLSCPGAGILTFAGIEEFTNLRTFDCPGNEAAFLDMRRSPLLERLDCSGNKLSTLYISGLRLLRRLNCGANLLSALDFSGCAALEWIECGSNGFVTLDVSACARRIEWLGAQNNPRLRTVYISSSQLLDAKALDADTSLVTR